MRTAAALGVMACLVVGGAPTRAVAQDLVSTTGIAPAFPAFTGSAADRASYRDEEAAAKRRSLRHIRKRVLALLPKTSAVHRAVGAVPSLPSRQGTTTGGGSFSIGPRTEGTLGNDAELAAGVEMRFTQTVDIVWSGLFEAYAMADALARAEDVVGGSLHAEAGHAVRAGVSLTLGDLRLSYDHRLNGGVGERMEGPSRQSAHLAYAIAF